jgi:monoterpene epsilon-lactone hydrolase
MSSPELKAIIGLMSEYQTPWVDLTEPQEWPGSDYYLGSLDPETPLASPAFAELDGLPPLLIQVGMDEPLLAQCRRLRDKARAEGVTVEHEEWDGMIHAWHLYAGMLSDGRQAIDRIAEFCRQL